MRMKRLIFVLIAFGPFAFSAMADSGTKSIYSCFISMDCNMKTGEISNQKELELEIILDLERNKLILGGKVYALYNKTETNNGFVNMRHYDAIDDQGQRCKIEFITDFSADWVTRNAIIIWYNEIGDIAKWYQSRDPQTR